MSHLLILGGGCAGLSLGLRLADDPGPYTRVTILETRSEYFNDRTWCFWRVIPHRFDKMISCSWSNISVKSSRKMSFANCSKTPYQMLESKDFYTYACDSIAKSSMVNIVLGVSVQGEPKQIGCKWQVQTLEGTQSKQLIADVVIDTRPLAPSHQESPTLWQSFLGQEIMTDGAVFDPTTVSLMDFDVEGSEEYGGITFSYVLPITQTRALIETTVFGTEPLSANMLTRRQGQTVARLCQGANYDIGRVESGILPMGLPSTNKRHVAPGYVRVGLMSGAVRPATGYAFQRIQRWADRCATSLRQGNGPCGHAPDPFLTRFMDKLFLQVLRAHPQQAPDIFVNLFGRANTASVIRFLSDQATLKDRVSIISALPFGLFLRELATREHPPKISMLTKITNNH